MTEISRRTFLYYAGLLSTFPACGVRTPHGIPIPEPQITSKWDFQVVEYPIPVPGHLAVPATRYVVKDTVTLPEGFTWEVVASWGDRFGPKNDRSKQIRFGYNCDFTTLIPKKDSVDEFWLCVNHEYVSARPWTDAFEEVYHEKLPSLRTRPYSDEFFENEETPSHANRKELSLTSGVGEDPLKQAACLISRLILEELGVSILHVKLLSDGRVQIIRESENHKRITPTRSINCNLNAKGIISGPASLLGIECTGTACNCSGGTTPWGTLLTCEENFQDIVAEWVRPSGDAFSPPLFAAEGDGDENGIPVAWQGMGAASATPLDARSFGWVTEFDPETGSFVKHSALGRFRHENITLQVTPGAALKAYMGDDRRGGHVWRFTSSQSVISQSERGGSKLFENGVLAVARFNSDHRGIWIPLVPSTPLAVPTPEHTSEGTMQLPARPSGGAVVVATKPENPGEISVSAYVSQVEHFVGKPFSECTLGDLVIVPDRHRDEANLYKQAVILMDAFLMANAIGGTPSARPEDLEVDPYKDQILIAFTESSGTRQGSPDVRVFADAGKITSRRYGAIFAVTDKGACDFEWQQLVTSGEVVEGGSGLACADNLAIDEHGDLWVVCDIATRSCNASVDRSGTSLPGSKDFMGIFGNSSLFRFQRTAKGFSEPECFAIGPCECELTGPTFLPKGAGILLSVQHPGEQHGTLRTSSFANGLEERTLTIADVTGTIVTQTRLVPIGSNFPSGSVNRAPIPCVIQIRPPL